MRTAAGEAAPGEGHEAIPDPIRIGGRGRRGEWGGECAVRVSGMGVMGRPVGPRGSWAGLAGRGPVGPVACWAGAPGVSLPFFLLFLFSIISYYLFSV